MNKDLQKKRAAEKAIEFIEENIILGVGTGSTTAHFINALSLVKNKIKVAVSSSLESTNLLKKAGISVTEANNVDLIDLYVDGADEVSPYFQLIKGGGAALTGEKILVGMSKKFICIVDDSKQVETLGRFPLPIEVIPMARSFVAREIVKLGGIPRYRTGVKTDYGNVILDIHDLEINEPIALENKINQIPGVVTVGLFANRGADLVIVGKQNDEIEILSKK